MKIKINRLKCNKCGHEWIPRVEEVFVCPRCHSYRWKYEAVKEDAKTE